MKNTRPLGVGGVDEESADEQRQSPAVHRFSDLLAQIDCGRAALAHGQIDEVRDPDLLDEVERED